MDASAAALPRLQALRELVGEIALLDLRRGDDDAVAAAAHGQTLRVVLERAVELLVALQDMGAPSPDDEPDAWTVPVDLPGLGDVCFAGALELRRVLRELAAARAPDDLVAAAETARRKLRRALRAALEATQSTLGHDLLTGVPSGPALTDLSGALAVRRLYAQFRRALRRPEDDSSDAVLAAVRYAGGALAALVSSPDYADVRASDRAILRRLRERALRWARGDRAVAAGLHLLEDIFTCGDLLRGINQRQELRAHDAAAIAALCAPGAADDVAAWTARLATLEGLDDGLDELIGRGPIDEIEAHLRRMGGP